MDFVLQHSFSAATPLLCIGERQVPVVFRRNPRARRYVLRVQADGATRLTIPRGGTIHQAWRFVRRNLAWLERHLECLASHPSTPRGWKIGTEILFRGTPTRLESAGPNSVRLGSEMIPVRDLTADLRPKVEVHLWRMGRRELPSRVVELARPHGFPVRRISVRNQRSRWGSCSRRGTISLNWRLIQAPGFVRDYIIVHELCHMWEMNHSARFWRQVESLCPDYRDAERWLKLNSRLLR